MNNRTFVFLLLVSAVVFSAGFTAQDINPNGSSELSLLMRKMEKQLVDARADVIKGTYKGSYPKEFDQLKTAAPTDAGTKTENYDIFADLYLSSVKNFVAAKTNQVQAYDNVVNTCLACHSQHCPGPVGRIKKLKISN